MLIVVCTFSVVFFMSSNKNYNGPIIQKILFNTYQCENETDLSSWKSVAELSILPEVNPDFYKKVVDAKLKHPKSCTSETLDSCEVLIMKYIIDNEFIFNKFIKSQCIKPKIPFEVKLKVEQGLAGLEAEEDLTVLKFTKERIQNLAQYIDHNLKEIKNRLNSSSKLYDRIIRINYISYDLTVKDRALYLFRKEYEDLTKLTNLIRPNTTESNVATFLVNLKDFKGLEKLNLFVMNGIDKDMHGLDLSWTINEKDELWLIENGTKIYEKKETAIADFENNTASTLYVYYFRDDKNYKDWGLHVFSNQTNVPFTNAKRPLAGKVVGDALRFEIKSELIGKSNDLNLALLNIDPSKDIKTVFNWKAKKNSSFKIIQKKNSTSSGAFN